MMVLFYFFNIISISSFARLNVEEFKEVKIDTSYISENAYKNAKSIIDWFSKRKDTVLKNHVLKDVAISYAYLNMPEKATEYAEKYIKKTHTTEILKKDAFVNIKDSEKYKLLAKKYLPEFNGWIVFFFASGLIGLFLSVVLNLRKKGDTIANLLISAFIFFHSVFMIHLCLFLSKTNFLFPNSLYVSTSFSFLYGPLLYFYFKRISEEYKFKVKDLIHVLPSVLLFLYFLPIYLLDTDQKLHLLYNRDDILHSVLTSVVILKNISLVFYAYLIFKIYKRNVKQKEGQHIEILNWQRNMMIMNIVYVVFYLIYGIALISIVMVNILIYPQIFCMAMIILYVGGIAFIQPKVFSKQYIFSPFKRKYIKSGLTTNFSIELKEQLIYLLNNDKIYKEPDLTLEVLSERLDTTRHNTSQVINEHFNMNFFTLINKFRITEALEILKSDFNNNLKIIDVAYDVGFNNKVTFNKAFKAETGKTPSQHLQDIRKRVIT